MHESPGVRGICANVFFVQVRFGTEPIVKEEGLINLSCLYLYQLLQSTRFEIFLLVILHFDSALGEGGCSLISAI